MKQSFRALVLGTCLFAAAIGTRVAGSALPESEPAQGATHSRVIVVHNKHAVAAFSPNSEAVRSMVDTGITALTGQSTVSAAWLSLVSTQDTIGIKVVSAPGPLSGTRPSVVTAVVEGLLAAGVPPKQIVIWDKHYANLRLGGYVDLATRLGVEAAGSADAGYDDAVFYDSPLLGRLIWGDVEFGKKEEGTGRKSFVSKLVTTRLTKIIQITPMLNHTVAGVAGNLYTLVAASVDNMVRFESSPGPMAQAVPEIYAFPQLGDRVAVNIVDALICQYQGEELPQLHHSTTLSELRFSTDPVALDVLSLLELDRQRELAKIPSPKANNELYSNAGLLELGVFEPSRIKVLRVK